jgi:hypothetical protein
MISGLHPLLQEQVVQAEINFKLGEERGQWHQWRATDVNSLPPWWEAGAEYVWELLLAHVNAFLRHTPAAHFESVSREWLLELSGKTFQEKVMLYERDGQRRKSEFVSFVQNRLATQFIKLMRERWELLSQRPGSTGTGTGSPQLQPPVAQRKGVPAVLPETGTARSKAKPGPKLDKDTAQQVAEIVRPLANGQPLKDKLDDICEALDQAQIPCPKTWRKREPAMKNWADGAAFEPELAKKAIKHHLKNALK